MTPKPSHAEVIDLLLEWSQKELSAPEPAWWWRVFLGAASPLRLGYVEHCLTEEHDGFVFGPAQAVWRVTPNKVERMPSGFTAPTPDTSKDHRYDCVYFQFTLPDESGVGVISQASAPLCGGGYRYRIKSTAAGSALEMESTWIS